MIQISKVLFFELKDPVEESAPKWQFGIKILPNFSKFTPIYIII